MNNDRFSFEDLEVWQEAVDFADKCLDIIERVQTDRRHYRLVEQLESAATSPALNIAEGKGRFSKKSLFISFILPGVLFSRLLLFW